jgi:hypothetical protein
MRAMSTHDAACSCGQLSLEATGDPVRVSVCHCLACQRRTGSAFGVQARFPEDRVQVSGRFTEFVRLSDENGEERLFRFCPDCGATVFYTTADSPDLIAVPVGAFADPSFPPPTVAVNGDRRHSWVELAAGVESDEAWDSIRPLYEGGRYDEAADRGRELVDAHPGYAWLAYNVACCESLAGRAGDAVGHLRRAIGSSDEFRALAADDSDFDPIRGDAAFRELVG